jgi:hypothetical protein
VEVSFYSLTPWCRVLLEKLTGLQPVKKFPAFLWNPKVHYRTHKRPPPVPVLGQPKPVHIPTSHLLEIHPNIIHPSRPRSPQWSLSLQFPHQDPIHLLSSPIRAISRFTLHKEPRYLLTWKMSTPRKVVEMFGNDKISFDRDLNSDPSGPWPRSYTDYATGLPLIITQLWNSKKQEGTFF